MALRGQEQPSIDLLDYRYREHFGMTQEDLDNEPQDKYELNLGIMLKESMIANEIEDHKEKEIKRNLNR